MNEKELSDRMEHTPAPWASRPTENYGGTVVLGPDRECVAIIGSRYIDNKENEANARLIAAAPELLEALINADKLITQLMPGVNHVALLDYGFLNKTLMTNTQTIAKARGEQE